MKSLAVCCLFISVGLISFAQVGINPSGASPNAGAGLDVDFTNKGFLPPRLTTVQRNTIPSPVEPGMMIFNTDISCIEFYTGQSWFSPCVVDNCTTAPPAPVQNGFVNLTVSSIRWNWIASPGAVRYRVNSVNNFATAQTVATNYFVSTGLTCGQTHTIYIWAENACGYSSPIQMSSSLSCCPLPGMTHQGGLVIASTQSPCSGFIKGTTPQESTTWNIANANCDASVAGGYTDWVLPNTPSLSQMNVLINAGTVTLEQEGMTASWYWSSTPGAQNGQYQWFHIPSFPDNIADVWPNNNQRYFCVRPF